MTFYQFINSHRGAQYHDILMLGGQLNPQQWEHFEQNWLQAKQDWQDKVKTCVGAKRLNGLKLTNF